MTVPLAEVTFQIAPFAAGARLLQFIFERDAGAIGAAGRESVNKKNGTGWAGTAS